MKVIVSLIFVLILIVLGSTDPIQPWENNQCYQEKKKEIEDAGGYKQKDNEVGDARIKVTEECARFLCMPPEVKRAFESFVFSSRNKKENKVNLPCFKAALKSLKPESSLVDGAECDDDKIKNLIESAMPEYNNRLKQTFKFDDMNLTSCTYEEFYPKNLFLTIDFEQKILSNSDFEDERKSAEVTIFFEDLLLVHESMFNCVLKQFKSQ